MTGREATADPTQPRLILALLIDVSASMASSLRIGQGGTTTRLEALLSSLRSMVRAGGADPVASHAKERVRIASYGYGFREPFPFLLPNPQVQDLLDIHPAWPATPSLAHLAEHWPVYEKHLASLFPRMLGTTPMGEGFRKMRERLRKEQAEGSGTLESVLFVLSDGEPTDSSPAEIVEEADALKSSHVTIVSAYVTDTNLLEPRVLYDQPPSDWPIGATLMFHVASELPKPSSLEAYLREFHWTFSDHSRLFSQVNHSDLLTEYMTSLLSPAGLAPRPAQSAGPVRVFVSYSHQDRAYLEEDSLLGYLRGLEREGFAFWWDQRLQAGDLWDREIHEQLQSADIALLLISQSFLNSRYCMDVEVSTFIQERGRRGMSIVPILLSPCDWRSYRWLADTQFEPRHGGTLETDYRDKGGRAALYLRILEQLRSIAVLRRPSSSLGTADRQLQSQSQRGETKICGGLLTRPGVGPFGACRRCCAPRFGHYSCSDSCSRQLTFYPGGSTLGNSSSIAAEDGWYVEVDGSWYRAQY